MFPVYPSNKNVILESIHEQCSLLLLIFEIKRQILEAVLRQYYGNMLSHKFNKHKRQSLLEQCVNCIWENIQYSVFGPSLKIIRRITKMRWS